MASNSGWSKGLPSATSSVALGDDDIRSNNSVLQAAWEDEHYFTDGSANSAGVHKEGSARIFTQAAQPTAVAPEGQLWHDTDDNALYVYAGSAWTQVNSAGAAVGSINTFTAQQNFTGNVKFGSAGAILSSVTTAFAVIKAGQTPVTAASSDFTYLTSLASFGDCVTVQRYAPDVTPSYSLVLSSDILSDHSVRVNVYNPTASDIAINSDWTFLVTAFRF